MLNRVPFVVVLLLLAVLGLGLSRRDVPPAERLAGQKLAAFSLPGMKDGEVFSPALWQGKVAFINAFASWCEPCHVEHETLMKLAATKKIPLYGIAWRDKKTKAADWLKSKGNPYEAVGIDTGGSTTVALALTGVPESFVVDKKGMVRLHIGAMLTDDIVEQKILPLVEALNAE